MAVSWAKQCNLIPDSHIFILDCLVPSPVIICRKVAKQNRNKRQRCVDNSLNLRFDWLMTESPTAT